MQVMTSLTHMVCGRCGVHFAMDDTFEKERRESGGTWYCPNGHPRIYTTPEVVKLRRALQEAQQAAIDARTAEKNSRAHALRELTRRQNIEKRVSAGVCPHCHRTFKQVAAHMERQHPQEAHHPMGALPSNAP